MQTLLQLVQPIGTVIFLIVAALVVLSPTIIGPLILRRWLSSEREKREHWRSWLSFAVFLGVVRTGGSSSLRTLSSIITPGWNRI